jgi:hypothetical protein
MTPCPRCHGDGYFSTSNPFDFYWGEAYRKYCSPSGRLMRVMKVLRAFGLRGLITHRHMLLSKCPEVLYVQCDHVPWW